MLLIYLSRPSAHFLSASDASRNFALHHDLKPKIQQTKNVVFAGFEKTKGLQFLIRVKDGATAHGLLKALEERLEKAKK
jgi:hypothetical protein